MPNSGLPVWIASGLPFQLKSSSNKPYKIKVVGNDIL